MTTESRYQGSPADLAYKNRNRPLAQMEQASESGEQPQESVDSQPEIYKRVEHVLSGLRSLIPEHMQKAPQARILLEIMGGMKRDISTVPEAQVKEFMRNIGQACTWIADGKMSDLEENKPETEDA
jgi:hypothetical protein